MAGVDLEQNLQKLADSNSGDLLAVVLSQHGDSWQLFTGVGGDQLYRKVSGLNGHDDYLEAEVNNPQNAPHKPLYFTQRTYGRWHVASNSEADRIGFALAAEDRFEPAHRVYTSEDLATVNGSKLTAAVRADLPFAWMGKVTANDNFTAFINVDSGFRLNPGEGYLMTSNDQAELGAWRFEARGTLDFNLNQILRVWNPDSIGSLAGKEIDRKTGLSRFSVRTIYPFLG